MLSADNAAAQQGDNVISMYNVALYMLCRLWYIRITPFTLLQFKPCFSAVRQYFCRRQKAAVVLRKFYLLIAVNTVPLLSLLHICGFSLAKACNTCIAPQITYRVFRGAGTTQARADVQPI